MTEENLIPRPRGLLIVAAIPAAFALYAAFRTGDLMGHYREMLEGLGAPIPPLTEAVLNAPNLWWIIAVPAVAVFVWVARRAEITPTQKARMQLAVAAVILFGAAVYGFVLFALQGAFRAMSSAV
jgi:hypothetical protein